MSYSIAARFSFETEVPTDILLQFEAADIPEQRLLFTDTCLSSAEHVSRLPAQDNIGERIWLRSSGRFDVLYHAQVEVHRPASDLTRLDQVMPHDLLSDVAQYLFPSRYCPADRFRNFVRDQFGEISGAGGGGERVAAIRDWIAQHFTYDNGASGPHTTGEDSFIERRGVCRDFAHVLVMLARASAIPARYVSCYAPGVDPQDFHAVTEVFLSDPAVGGGAREGAWHIVDATGMANESDTVTIGVGHDAGDVSFLTSFGPSTFLSSEVSVTTN